MKKKWLLILGVAFVLAFTTIVFVIENTKKRDISSENVEYHVYANELMHEFEMNETTASQKYNSKIIEIKGKIGEVIKNQDNRLTLILKEKDDMFGINCAFMVNDINLNKFVAGDSITIKGIFQGYLDDVIINNCILNK